MKYLTFGEIMLRLSTKGSLPLLLSMPGELEASFGGGEANVAVALSSMGGDASFLTLLPKGLLSDACLAALRARGVNTKNIIKTENDRDRFGIYFLEQGSSIRPSKVVYDRAHSAIANASENVIDWIKAFDEIDWFHLTGITPAISGEAARAALKGVETAKSCGCKISLDLNFRSKLWRWKEGVKPEVLAKRTMMPFVEKSDLIIGNEEDAFRVLGLTVPGLDLKRGKLNGESYVELAKKTADLAGNVSHVAFSLRSSKDASCNFWGGMLYDVKTGKSWFSPVDEGEDFRPLEISPIIDRVGSGDAFAAGLIYGLGQARLLPKEALSLGVAAGALAHTQRGDWLLSSLKEIQELARGETSGRIQR